MELKVPALMRVDFLLGFVAYGLPASTRVYPRLPGSEDTQSDIYIIWINPHLSFFKEAEELCESLQNPHCAPSQQICF